MGQNFESGKSSGWWSDVWNIKNVQIFPHARLSWYGCSLSGSQQ